MPASNAVHSAETKFYLSVSGVMTEIAEVMSVGGPGLQKDTVEVTHLRSPNRAKEFISSLRDFGEVTLELNYIPTNASHQALTDAYLSDDVQSAKVEFPDTTTIGPFSCHVTAFSPNAAKDAQLTASVTLKLTGHVDLPT